MGMGTGRPGTSGQVLVGRPTTTGGLVPAGSAAWSDALVDVRHDVYHRPEYVAFDAARVGGDAVAFVHREGARVLLVPFVRRAVPRAGRCDLTSPYGYPGVVSNAAMDDGGFWCRAVQAFRAQMRTTGALAAFARLHPLLPPRLDALGRVGVVVQHGQTVSVDLSLDDEAYRRGVRANHRRQIRRALDAGTIVRFDEWDRLDDFRSMYGATMSRVGAEAYYFFDRAYFEGLRAALGDDVHLATVHDTDGVIGGGLFFEHGGIVQYHLGATRPDALDRQPTKVLFDEVRRWARARGDTALHLGGGVGGRDNPLFRFKAGFSSDCPAFFTWRVVADREEYARLAVEAGVTDPEDDTAKFPAYRFPGEVR